MEEQRNYPPRRRRKPVPKWKRLMRKYWPPVRLGLIVLAFLLIVGFGISAVIRQINADDKGKDIISSREDETTPGPSSSPDPTVNDPTPESTKDSETSAPTIGGWSGIIPVGNAEKKEAAEKLMAEATAVSLGYDYEGAIEMLTAFEYYNDFPEMANLVEQFRQEDAKLVTYQDMDKITHIFFHSLIVDPSRAFDKDSDQDGYNLYMTTCDEFWKMLEIMYERGYVLVSPYDVAYEVTDSSGTRFVNGTIRLPEGKKPFLMSQDDLNYYSYMIGTGSGVNETPIFADTKGDGFASRIVIDENGFPTCEYMDKDGNITYGDYDLVPLLEKFIQQHPDFSYHGARAILGMTGYEGVFGYRTKPAYEKALGSERYAEEVEAAKEVAQCLRDHGWILASHSYGHPAYGNISASRVAADSDKWENTVQPIIGNCDVILYPHGSDIAGAEHYGKSTAENNAKFKALYEDGYRYFFNVDGSTYWCQLGENYYRGGRRNLDGYRMYHYPNKLTDLFDVEDVFDEARPTPVPEI